MMMMMMCVTLLLLTLQLLVRGSSGDITMTQSPGSLSAVPGQTVSIKCKSSQLIGDDVNWYLQKPAEPPKLLIADTTARQSGVPDRFSATAHQTDFTLTIRNVQTEDVGVYYCQQHNSYPLTFGGGTRLDVGSNVRPTLTVLPPSKEELRQGTATLMCLANKGFPSDWTLSWKMDGSSISSSWEQSSSRGLLEKDGLYSWSSILRLSADQWRKAGSVTCEATQGSQTPRSETLRTDQCS